MHFSNLLCCEYLQGSSVFGCVVSFLSMFMFLQRIFVFGCVMSICSTSVFLIVL